MKKTTCLLVVLLVFLGVPVSTFGLMPVMDHAAVMNLIQTYRQLKMQYDLLAKTYENGKSLLDKTDQLARGIQGNYGFGNLENDLTSLKQRKWSPNSWEEALRGMSGGNKARYRELLAHYKENNPTLSQAEYEKGASPRLYKRYAREISVNQAVVVNSSYAFNDINRHLETIHRLSKQIEKTENLKASMDLNARLLAEVAYIQVQNLKLQALLNQQTASLQSSKIAQKTVNASFNQLPE